MKKIFKIGIFVLLVSAVIATGLLSYFFTVTKNVTVDENRLKSPSAKFVAYYNNGEKISFSNTQNYVKLEEIPKHVINAVISIEDKRFYEHNGISVRSMLRALKNNILSMKIKEGGSTISQQLVKNAYLSGEKTLTRKFKEIKLTLELESKYTKSEILEKYLNTVYFGENAYGIGSASKRFFGKSVEELTLSEGATLASSLKAPSYYNPFKNPDQSIKRRNLVLSEMHRDGYIDTDSYNNAKSSDLMLNFENNYESGNKLESEIIDEALSILKTDDVSALNDLSFYTNLDQHTVASLPKVGDYGIDCDLSIIVTDNNTGTINAYYSSVGNINRSPASTVKPILIYAPSIYENEISLATVINDEPTDFEGYSPSNYNDKYYGKVCVKDAISKSLNVPAVKLCNLLGCEKVKNYARKMGISFNNNDLSVALGNLSGGVTLKQISDAYSVFTHEGNFINSGFITKITNKKGKTVYEKKQNPVKVFDSPTAYLINDALKDCSKNGTAKKLSTLDYEVCAKTGTCGTVNGNTDAYCIAYTQEHTVAVWLGNADGSLMPNSISGGSYPTAIARDILSLYYNDKKPMNFPVTDTVEKVFIDEESYLNDGIILQVEKSSLSFFFKKSYIPRKKEIPPSPIVKDYKITCNYEDIEIFFNADKNIFIKITTSEGDTVYEGLANEKIIFKAPRLGINTFFAQPYYLIDGEKFFGEKIKLPTVYAEGKNDIGDIKWWEE